MFGANSGAFGSQAGGGFGAPAQPSGFGAQQPGGGAFGNTGFGAPTQSTGGFGQQANAFGSTSNTFGGAAAGTAFGQPQAQQQAGGAFGAGATTGGSTFGGVNQASGGFGAAPQQSAFGGTSGNTFSATGSPFGQANTGGFGAKPNTGFGASAAGGFGTGQTGGGTSAFGGLSNNAFGATTGSTFATAGGGSAFGGGAGTSTGSAFGAGAASGFGATTGGSFGTSQPGTAHTKYQVTQDRDNSGKPIRYQAISIMSAYSKKNLDELRWEDYQANRKGPSQSGFGSQPTTSPFGTTNAQSAFGAPAASTGGFASTGFGAPSSTFGAVGSSMGTMSASPFAATQQGGQSFGQTGGFGASKPHFGAGAGNAAGSSGGMSFGAPATSGAFGQTTGTGGGLFGGGGTQANAAAGGGGLFGGAQQQTQNAGGGLFGSAQQQTQNTGGGLFGKPAGSTAGGGGLFGGAQQQTQNAAGGLFGGGSAQANAGATGGGLFGGAQANAGATGGGLFGGATAQGNTGATGGGGLFGKPAASTTGGGGLFGGGTQQQGQAAGGGLFGGGTQANTGATGGGGLFGGGTQQQAQTATGGGLFGGGMQQQTQAATAGGLFGKPGGAAAGGGLFGGTQQQTQAGVGGGGGLFGTGNSQISIGGGGGGLFGGAQQTQPSVGGSSVGTAGSLFGGASASGGALANTQSSGLGVFATTTTPQAGALNVSSTTQAGVPSSSPYGTWGVPQATVAHAKAAVDILPAKEASAALERAQAKAADSSGAARLAAGALPYKLTPKSAARIRPRSRNLRLSINDEDEHAVKKYERFLPRQSVKTLVIEPEAEQEEGDGANERFSAANNSALHASGSQYGADGNDDGNDANDTHLSTASAGLSKSLLSMAHLQNASSPQHARGHDRNASAPHLSREGYYTVPSLAQLQRMTDDDLASVESFVVGCEGVGEVAFVGKTDVRDLDLDEIISFQDRSIDVYPDESRKPALGCGLNRPAIVTLQKCWPTDKRTGEVLSDPDRVAKFRSSVERQTKKMGATLLSLDLERGEWRFRVEHFSRYGLDDDDDDDDEDGRDPNGSTMHRTRNMTSGRSANLGGRLPGHATENRAPHATASVEGILSFGNTNRGQFQAMEQDFRVEEAGAATTGAMQQSGNRFRFPDAGSLSDDDDSGSEHGDCVADVREHSGFGNVREGASTEERGGSAVLADYGSSSSTERVAGAAGEGGDRLDSSSAYRSSLDANSSMEIDAARLLAVKEKEFAGDDRGDDAAALGSTPHAQTAVPRYGGAALYRKSERPPVPPKRAPEVEEIDERIASEAAARACGDAGLWLGRSFRVSFGPGGRIVLPRGTNILGSAVQVAKVSPLPAECASAAARLSEGMLRVHRENSNVQKSCDESSPVVSFAGADEQHAAEPQDVAAALDAFARWADSAEPTAAEMGPDAPPLDTWHLANALWGRGPAWKANDSFVGGEDGADPMDVASAESSPAMSPISGSPSGVERGAAEGARVSYSRGARGAIALHQQTPWDLAGYASALARRAAVSRYFARVLRQDALDAADVASESGDYLGRVKALVLGFRIRDACRVAVNHRDSRLAIMLAQLGVSSAATRKRVVGQLNEWERSGALDHIDSGRRKLFRVLAGDTPDGFGLSWLQTVAYYLWFVSENNAPITGAIELYAEDCNAFGRTPQSTAGRSTDDSTSTEKDIEKPFAACGSGAYDVRFHLLAVETLRGPAQFAALEPETYTQRTLDVSLAWHLLAVLRARDVPCDAATADRLHRLYAAQLECLGLWQWAVYVSCHLSARADATTTAREIVRRCWPTDPQEATRAAAFLRDDLCVPEAWIHDAAAQRAGYEHRYADEASSLLHASRPDEALDASLENLVPLGALLARRPLQAALELLATASRGASGCAREAAAAIAESCQAAIAPGSPLGEAVSILAASTAAGSWASAAAPLLRAFELLPELAARALSPQQDDCGTALAAARALNVSMQAHPAASAVSQPLAGALAILALTAAEFGISPRADIGAVLRELPALRIGEDIRLRLVERAARSLIAPRAPSVHVAVA